MATPQTHAQPGLLMERGVLALPLPGNSAAIVGTSQSVEIQRGMTVQSAEGCTVGHVAALLLDQDQHQVTHILLQELQQVIYRLTPVGLIERVKDKKVALSILLPVVESLPTWPGA